MDDAIETIGMAATGGIIAREMDRAHAPGSDHEGGPCANCGTILTGPYCVACGQHGHVHRTIGALFHDILHGVFHFEGRVWHTLPMLVFRPGELTRRYAQGERAKFVSPMALFLFSVFLMFAVSSSLTKGLNFGGAVNPEAGEVISAEYQRQAERLVRAERRIARIDKQQAGGEIDEGDIADRPELVERRDKARADIVKLGTAAKALGVDPRAKPKKEAEAEDPGSFESKFEHARNNTPLMAYKVKSYAYKYSWTLIPISLPFMWLLFPLRRDIGLYDHAIFAIYSLSFMTLFASLLAVLHMLWVPAWVLWTAFSIGAPVHMYRQLKGAYSLNRASALWRLSLLLIFTTITSSLFFALLMYLGSSD